jgi:hypothetical protein
MRLVHKFTDYITAHDIQGCFKEIIFEVLMSRQAFEEGRVDVFAYIAGRLRDIDSKRKQEQIEQIALEAEMKKLQLRKKAKKRAAGKHSGRNNSAPNSSRRGSLGDLAQLQARFPNLKAGGLFDNKTKRKKKRVDSRTANLRKQPESLETPRGKKRKELARALNDASILVDEEEFMSRYNAMIDNEKKVQRTQSQRKLHDARMTRLEQQNKAQEREMALQDLEDQQARMKWEREEHAERKFKHTNDDECEGGAFTLDLGAMVTVEHCPASEARFTRTGKYEADSADPTPRVTGSAGGPQQQQLQATTITLDAAFSVEYLLSDEEGDHHSQVEPHDLGFDAPVEAESVCDATIGEPHQFNADGLCVLCLCLDPRVKSGANADTLPLTDAVAVQNETDSEDDDDGSWLDESDSKLCAATIAGEHEYFGDFCALCLQRRPSSSPSSPSPESPSSIAQVRDASLRVADSAGDDVTDATQNLPSSSSPPPPPLSVSQDDALASAAVAAATAEPEVPDSPIPAAAAPDNLTKAAASIATAEPEAADSPIPAAAAPDNRTMSQKMAAILASLPDGDQDSDDDNMEEEHFPALECPATLGGDHFFVEGLCANCLVVQTASNSATMASSTN